MVDTDIETLERLLSKEVDLDHTEDLIRDAYRVALREVDRRELEVGREVKMQVISENKVSAWWAYAYGYHRGVKDILEKLGAVAE